MWAAGMRKFSKSRAREVSLLHTAMEAVLGSFAWHAGAVETVRALGLETSIALAVFLVVVLVVTGVCIVHEERKRKRSSTLRIAAGKKES